MYILGTRKLNLLLLRYIFNGGVTPVDVTHVLLDNEPYYDSATAIYNRHRAYCFVGGIGPHSIHVHINLQRGDRDLPMGPYPSITFNKLQAGFSWLLTNHLAFNMHFLVIYY